MYMWHAVIANIIISSLPEYYCEFCEGSHFLESKLCLFEEDYGAVSIKEHISCIHKSR